MRLKLISCEALAPELVVAMRRSVNQVEARFLTRSMNEVACRMRRQQLQEIIDASEGHNFQALLIALGFCAGGVAGLVARRLPLVIPRRCDSASLWQRHETAYSCRCRMLSKSGLGSFATSEAPVEIGSSLRQGWSDDAGAPSSGSNLAGLKDGGMAVPLTRERENTHSQASAAPETEAEVLERQATEEARWFGWDFESAPWELGLMQRFVDGYWGHDEFVVVPPGWRVNMRTEDGYITAEQNKA